MQPGGGQAQHLLARRVGLRVPVAEHGAPAAGAEQMVARPVGVAVHQRLGAGGVQPRQRGGAVDVGVIRLAPLALFALLAQRRAIAWRCASGRPRNCAASSGERTCSRNCMYSVSARHKASPCVSSQRLRAKPSTIGSAQQRRAACLQEALTHQEVAVARHEEHAARGRGGLQHRRAIGGEAGLAGHVVADPDLEQVAEDEDGVGRVLAM